MNATTGDTLRLTPADRVLVFAPHPDDESIACGGLLLAAQATGAARRVVTLTDGDNNPWPQRWLERRWRIDAAARARWAARRRAESQNALDVLGVAADERAYLGLGDGLLTSLLMREHDGLVTPLREEIARFRPTLVAAPALADRHPDHSAAHIAVRLALLDVDPTPRLLAYRVHGDGDAPIRWSVELDALRHDAKRRAITTHRTQMALGGRRFLAFAAPLETFADAAAAPRSDHPLRATLRHDRLLELRVREQYLHRHREVLIVAAEASARTHAWRLALASRTQVCELHDARDGRVVAAAAWSRDAGARTLALPLPAVQDPRCAFVKLARARSGLVIFDRYGWQPVAEGSDECGETIRSSRVVPTQDGSAAPADAPQSANAYAILGKS